MRGAPVGRLWVLGGAAGAVLLIVVSWFLFISPQNAETSSLEDQAAAAQLRANSLARRLAELKRQNEELPKYKAQLVKDRQALPTTSGLSDFLRELQVAGDSAGVTVQGVIVGSPTRVPAKAAQVHALPITLTAGGSSAKLSRFLDQLQRLQPRAVLISSANAVPDDANGSLAGSATLTLTVAVFTATPAG
jgi:Tfp pilus assembly protein PilO